MQTPTCREKSKTLYTTALVHKDQIEV